MEGLAQNVRIGTAHAPIVEADFQRDLSCIRIEAEKIPARIHLF